MVVEDRIDLIQLDEVLYLDRARFLGLERVELLRLDHHVAIGSQLVAFDDVLVGDLLVVLGIDALLGDPRSGLAGKLVKAHRLAVDGAVQPHRHGHQPEADRARPHRAGHATVLPRHRPHDARCPAPGRAARR